MIYKLVDIQVDIQDAVGSDPPRQKMRVHGGPVARTRFELVVRRLELEEEVRQVFPLKRAT